MAYDEALAARIRDVFSGKPEIVEKKMFGGIAFMYSGHMCVGVTNDMLMARVGPEQYEAALALPYAQEMDFTGRSMRGFIYVAPEGIATEVDLRSWMELCEKFVSSLPPK